MNGSSFESDFQELWTDRAKLAANVAVVGKRVRFKIPACLFQ